MHNWICFPLVQNSVRTPYIWLSIEWFLVKFNMLHRDMRICVYHTLRILYCRFFSDLFFFASISTVCTEASLDKCNFSSSVLDQFVRLHCCVCVYLYIVGTVFYFLCLFMLVVSSCGRMLCWLLVKVNGEPSFSLLVFLVSLCTSVSAISVRY